MQTKLSTPKSLLHRHAPNLSKLIELTSHAARRKWSWCFWIWIAYTALMLMLIIGMTAFRSLACGVIAEILSFPSCLLVIFFPWGLYLPDSYMYFVYILVVILNGGLGYTFLKLLPRVYTFLFIRN